MITIIHFDQPADKFEVLYRHPQIDGYSKEIFDTLEEAKLFCESWGNACLYAFFAEADGYVYAEWVSRQWMTDSPDFDGKPIQGDLMDYLAELKQQSIAGRIWFLRGLK